MTQLAKTNEGPDPVNVGFFGAQTVMFVAQSLAQLIQQPDRLKRWPGDGLGGAVSTVHSYKTHPGSLAAQAFPAAGAPRLMSHGGRLAASFEQLIAPHLRPHECRVPVLINAVNRKDVLGKIDSHRNNRRHGLPLRNERTHKLLPGSLIVRSGRRSAAGVGRGSPFHSLGTDCAAA